MALDRFAAYILAKTFKISPVLLSKMAQKKWTPKRAYNAFLVALNSSTFPTEKKTKCVVSARKISSNLVLSKGVYIYTHIYTLPSFSLASLSLSLFFSFSLVSYIYIYIYAGELVLVPLFCLSRVSFCTTSRVRNSTTF